jgi:hypothetical protein
VGLSNSVRNRFNGKTYSVSTVGHESAVFEGGVFATLNQKKNLRFSRSPRFSDLHVPMSEIHGETVEMVANQDPVEWIMTWPQIEASRDIYIKMPTMDTWH